jgi:glycosyltransferase involved in cell wall biosynthesis
MKRVSILIPCYNAERFIKEAVQSALDQDYNDKEVIVIDDGSTDDSLSIVKAFESKIILSSRENKGGNFTRNELLQKASGEWIQYLDADDYLAPGKLSEQMNWINANPGYDVVYGAVMAVYDDGGQKRFEKQEVIYPDDPWAAMVSWQLPQTSSPLFRKKALLEVSGWKNEQKVCQEHELYLRLLKVKKKFIGVKEFSSLTHYRHWSSDTVSKRNLFSTYKTRMSIMEDALHFMSEKKILNNTRREVFLEWCILLARGIWSHDQQLATDFYKRYEHIYPVKKIMSIFLTPYYLRTLDWIGFEWAERLASFRRKAK